MARGRRTKGAVAGGGGGKMAEFAAVRGRVAEAAGLLDAAQLLLLRDADEVLALARARKTVDIASRIRSRRDHALAKHISVNWDAVGAIYGQHAFGLEPNGQYRAIRPRLPQSAATRGITVSEKCRTARSATSIGIIAGVASSEATSNPPTLRWYSVIISRISVGVPTQA